MDFQHIGSVTKSIVDSPRVQPHGSTMTDGKPITPQRQGKAVNVTSLKQATWIKSKLLVTKPSKASTGEWRQIVMHPGTKEILSDLPAAKKLSPMEIINRWPGVSPITSMKMITESMELATQGEQNADEKFRITFGSPASKETILAHLLRVSAIKPIKGTNKTSSAEGDTQTAFLLDDYTTRLLNAKVTEVDLFIALDHFIENDDNEFFPSYAKLKKRL